MFRDHLLEEPDEKISVSYKKACSHLQTHEFHRTSCENCESWTLHLGHVKSMLISHYDIKEITIPSKTSFNVVSVISSPTCVKTEDDATVHPLITACVEKGQTSR